MKKLTLERANELKAAGITQIASIIKSHYDSKYFGVASIDEIVANGGMRPKRGKYNFTKCECSIIEKDIDWKRTIRWSQI